MPICQLAEHLQGIRRPPECSPDFLQRLRGLEDARKVLRATDERIMSTKNGLANPRAMNPSNSQPLNLKP